MLFTLICPRCADNTEIYAEANEPLDTIYDCDRCGAGLCRRDNRNWSQDVPMISGDTCAGSVDYSNYYDEGLQAFVTGRQHRQELMKERGFAEYEPTSEMSRMREESAHIRRNAPKDDPAAINAIRQLGKDADKKRKERTIDEHIGKFRDSLTK